MLNFARPNRSVPTSARAGAALLYALFTVLVAAGLIATTTVVASVAHKSTQRKRFETEAQYLAEGAVEFAKKGIQQAIANWSVVPANGVAQVGDRSIPYEVRPTGFTSTTADGAGIETSSSATKSHATAIVQGTKADLQPPINTRATPIFQFAVFYTADLEINPGPDMTSRGRVHSNPTCT